MKVLMVGATGRFAGLVLPELVKRDVTVRALVRNEAGAAEARRRGAAETTLGDLRTSESLRAAAEGVDGVFHLNPAFADGEAEMGAAIVRVAAAAGVRRFVFSSVYHPSLSLTNHAAKRPVEEALYESNMEYTVLQPAMFMQLLAGSFSDAARDGRISGPYSKRAKMSYVDYRDVAEAAALALTGDELVRGTFELSAPGMWDRVEVAALLSRVLGREVSAQQSPPGDAGVERMAPGPLRDGLARMTEHYDAHGFSGGNALVLRAVLGREPRTLEAYFRELAGDRVAGSPPEPAARPSRPTDLDESRHTMSSPSSAPTSTVPPDDLDRDLTVANADDPALTHLAVVGDTYTFLVTGEQTAGRYALIDMLIPPDGGPPPHRHDFEEMFHVLEGEIEVVLRGESTRARAGDTVNVPANAPHSFHNASGAPVRLLCMVSPAGLEDYFTQFGEPVATRTSVAPESDDLPERMAKAMALAPDYRIENLAP